LVDLAVGGFDFTLKTPEKVRDPFLLLPHLKFAPLAKEGKFS
jgi:hypothetical protein